ncbi:MAG: kelch repeat-containing protein [Crocinitomicaceae bacterium]|nr:kelch repeat-containing protein [Crocinitomicaceae bacterium]
MKLFLVLTSVLLSNLSFAFGWVQKSDFEGTARHRTVGIAITTKAYVGLGHYNGAGVNVLFNDWWEYDPSTNAWTQKADYLGGACYDAVGFTIDELGYVGTGRTSANGSILVQDFFKYNPVTNSWSSIASFIGTGRRGAVSFVIDGNAYVGTGETNFGRTSSFYKYSPTLDVWTQVAFFGGSSRTAAVGFSIGGFGYVGTGNLSSGSSNDFWQYNPSLDSWTQKAAAGPLMRQESSGFELGGKGYILTGLETFSGTNYSDMWEYDPTANNWIQVDDFQGIPRRYLTSIVLNGYIYAGLGTNGVNFCDWWVYDSYLSTLEQKLEQSTIKTYPNPASEFVTFDLNLNDNFELKNTTLELINSVGKVVRNVRLEESKLTLETIDLPSGTYYCR